nr:hypothetical protein [Magnetococcales bacterium]
MTDRETPRRNPLFHAYGRRVVEVLTAPEPFRVGGPGDLLPGGGGDLPGGGGADRVGTGLEPEELERFHATVNRLRQHLVSKDGGSLPPPSTNPAGDAPGGGDLDALVAAQWERFQAGLAGLDEKPLSRNPFYELTRLLFRYNLRARRTRLLHMLRDLLLQRPRPLGAGMETLLPSDPEAPGGGAWSRLERLIVPAKALLEILLSMATALAMALALFHLMPWGEGRAVTSGWIGLVGLWFRHGVALVGGLAVALVVLDWRRRLFRELVESGRWGGLGDAWRRHPRWMTLAGLVLLFSLTADLWAIAALGDRPRQARDWAEARSRLEQVLGGPDRPGGGEDAPLTLYDWGPRFQDRIQRAVELLRRMPEAERAGAAGRSIAKEGPRFWAKEFVVNGGYRPGVRDVVSQYGNRPRARDMDRLLQESGLDLTQPLAWKLSRVAAAGAAHLDWTRQRVADHLAAVEGMLADGWGLWAAPDRVSGHLGAIRWLLRAHRTRMGELLEELAVLERVHLALLGRVEDAGSGLVETFRAALPPPVLPLPLDGRVPEWPAGPEFPHWPEAVDDAAGVWILPLGLAIALGPLVLFGPFTLGRGRRERRLGPRLLCHLQAWEDTLFEKSAQFLIQPEVGRSLPGLILPNEIGIRNAFHSLLEDLDWRTRHLADRSRWQNARCWFRELFWPLHMVTVAGYDRRVRTLGRLCADPVRGIDRLMAGWIPGLDLEQGVGTSTFAALLERCQERGLANKRRFEQQLDALGHAYQVNRADLHLNWGRHQVLRRALQGWGRRTGASRSPATAGGDP